MYVIGVVMVWMCLRGGTGMLVERLDNFSYGILLNDDGTLTFRFAVS